MTEDAEHGNILSNDLKSPGLVTSITYQTLYSGMNRYKGELQEEDTAGAASLWIFPDLICRRQSGQPGYG